MTKYVAFLRGVNVGGVRVPMAELRQLCEELGYQDVKTYVNSGNVIFESGASASRLEGEISESIKQKFRYDIPVMVKSKAQVATAIATNPYKPNTGDEHTTLHVVFVTKHLNQKSRTFLKSLSVPEERIEPMGDRVYILLKRFNFPKSTLGKNVIEKKLKVKATARNWNTLNNVYDLM